MRLVLSVLAVTIAGVASAQTFFRDDFNTLSPEWVFTPPSEDESAFLTYEVNQGNLIATGVNPGSQFGFEGGGRFERLFLPRGQYMNGLTDQVRLRARFTLPRGDVIQRMSFSLVGINEFGWSGGGGQPYGIQRLPDGQYASTLSSQGGGTSNFSFWQFDPVPYYQLDVFREGTELVATLNGLEVNRRSYTPAGFNQIRMNIIGFYGQTSVGPRIDYIEVVPEPVTLAGFGAAAAGLLFRRKKK